MLLPRVFADATTYFIVLFEHGDAGAALRETACGGETAYTSADYDHVWRLQCCCNAREDERLQRAMRPHSCAKAVLLNVTC